MPFVRSRLVSANVLSRLRPNFAFASAVASWTIASGSLSSTALRTAPRVEQIERDRPRAERPQLLGACRRVVGADHLVACVDQLGNEPAADRAARSCDENAHRVLLFVLVVTSRGSRGSTSMTRGERGT